jgi:PASTA domain
MEGRRNGGLGLLATLAAACAVIVGAPSVAASDGLALALPAAARADSPTVATLPATEVTAENAVLHATVNPNGTPTVYRFTYDPNNVLHEFFTLTRTVGNGAVPVAVSSRIGGLLPGTEYRFVIEAEQDGSTTRGEYITFTTSGFRRTESCLVPRVTRLRYETATRRIRAAGCSLGRVSYVRGFCTGPFRFGCAFGSEVYRQKPRAGTRLKKFAKVNITVGKRRKRARR